MRNLLMLSVEEFFKDECCTLTLEYHEEKDVMGHFVALVDVVVDGQMETVTARGSIPDSAINSALAAAKSLVRLKRSTERDGNNEC